MYNGWSNYETWCAKLWIDNDDITRQKWETAARVVWDNAKPEKPFSREEKAWIHLAEQLKADIADNGPCSLLDEASLYSDLLRTALGEVNWHEIARNIIAGFVDVSKTSKAQTCKAWCFTCRTARDRLDP